jgi:antitoxin HicB
MISIERRSRMRYPVTLTPDDNGTVIVTFPDVPDAITYGDTTDEALARAPDALLTIVDAFIKDRRDIPVPSATKGPAIVVPALETAKIELYRTMRAARVSKSELARRLDCHLPQIDRLLAISHGSRLDQLEAAFHALGKRLEVHVEDQAAPARAARPVASTLDEQLARLSPVRRRRVEAQAAALIAAEWSRQQRRHRPTKASTTNEARVRTAATKVFRKRRRLMQQLAK